jgi:hypothetical protein
MEIYQGAYRPAIYMWRSKFRTPYLKCEEEEEDKGGKGIKKKQRSWKKCL